MKSDATTYAILVFARHFRMNNSPPGSHELKVAGPYRTLVSGEIFMINRAMEKICNRLLSTVER